MGFPLATAVSQGSAVAAAAVVQASTIIHRWTALVSNMGRSETKRRARGRALSNPPGDALVGFDVGGSVVQVSPECEDLFGVPASELTGGGLVEHVHVADRAAFLKLVGDAARGTQTASDVFRLHAGSADAGTGSFVAPRFLWIGLRARGLADQPGPRGFQRRTGSRPHVVAILRDVTVSRRHDLEFEARNSIESAIRSKDHFLANMSHELRTPLNAIIGFSELLASRALRPDDPDKQREYARIINQSGQHLLSVVNSILDMSKIQSGTFPITPEPFDIVPLIELCCDMVTFNAREGRIQLERDCPDTLEEIVGDKRAYKQILINLLSNAVKFTPEQGRVTIKARPEGNLLAISVTDTGIGIGPADLMRLGTPFFQARSSLSRPYEGTGLGLSVVRGLIGLHGGRIAIESEIGKGTSVTVRLPLDCRGSGQRDVDAAIDVVARRQPIETAAPSQDRRMKQIA